MKDIKINYLHFCDAANVDSLGKVSILGIFGRIFLQSVPGICPKFTIIFNRGFKNLDKTNNKIELKLFGPNKEELEIKPSIALDFMVNEADLKKEGDINLILEIVNLEFKSFGKHNLTIYLNGEEIGSKPLLVEERKVN